MILSSFFSLLGDDTLEFLEPKHVHLSDPRKCGQDRYVDLSQVLDTSGREGKGNQREVDEIDPELFKEEKMVFERPRIIARIRHDENWKANPYDIKNLLLFFEDQSKIPILRIEQGPLEHLTYKQKETIYNQLPTFEVKLTEKKGERIDRPITSGFVPRPEGGDQMIAEFDVLFEDIAMEAADYLVLYMTGFDDFNLSQDQIKVLRNYLLRGGFLIADPAAGQEGFDQGFRRLVEALFPRGKLEELPLNHAVYNTLFKLEKIRYTGKIKPKNNRPTLMGLNIGCRTAILYSPHTIGCGWDGHMHGESSPREVYFKDAFKLGANMLTYASGFRNIGKPLPELKSHLVKDREQRSKFSWNQLKYEGDWDPEPLGTSGLLLWLAENTNIPINLDKVPIEAKDINHTMPFLFLTGTGNLKLSKEVYKKYIDQGGFLFVTAACGSSYFDQSFRQWVKETFPEMTLELLPPHDPILKSVYSLDSIPYRKGTSGFGKQVLSSYLSEGEIESWVERERPIIEVLRNKKKEIVLMYSPLDLLCAWKEQPCLTCKGYDVDQEKAFKIIVNLLIHLMT